MNNRVVRNAQLIQVMSFYFIRDYILPSFCTFILKSYKRKRTIISLFVENESWKIRSYQWMFLGRYFIYHYTIRSYSYFDYFLYQKCVRELQCQQRCVYNLPTARLVIDHFSDVSVHNGCLRFNVEQKYHRYC